VGRRRNTVPTIMEGNCTNQESDDDDFVGFFRPSMSPSTEYISTLEGDIAERDRLLEAIRSELGSSRNENLALRREVENLKRCC
jgi:hypothetical protein